MENQMEKHIKNQKNSNNKNTIRQDFCFLFIDLIHIAAKSSHCILIFTLAHSLNLSPIFD